MGLSKLILYSLFCTTKFLIGIGLLASAKISFLEGMFFALIGGFAGVFFYLFALEFILQKISPKKTAKQFKMSKRGRFMIKVRQKGGLLGVAALTPLILSIPVGIALSITLGASKNRILIFHICSVAAWALLILGAKFVFGFNFADNF